MRVCDGRHIRSDADPLAFARCFAEEDRPMLLMLKPLIVVLAFMLLAAAPLARSRQP
jgi:hypothetical protein